MYANAPHASAATPSPQALQQHHALQQQHVQPGHLQPQGVPARPQVPATGMATPVPMPAAPPRQAATGYVTGAYQPSGDPAIDRMLRLEAACKRFGSLV